MEKHVSATHRLAPALRFVALAVSAALSCAVAPTNAAPAREDGIRTGGLVLNPYVRLTLAYDEDPGILSSRDEENEGLYADTRFGCKIRSSRQNALSLTGEGWFNTRRSFEDADLDGESYGQHLDFEFGDPRRLAVRLQERVTREIDYPYDEYDAQSDDEVELLDVEDLADRYERTTVDLGALLARDLTDKTPLETEYSYEDTDRQYRGQYDSTSHRLTMGLGYRWTDKTTVSLNGGGGVEDNESYAEAVDFYTGGMGLSWLVTDKTDSFLNAGVEVCDEAREKSSTESREPENSEPADDITAFVYRTGLRWDLTDKTALSLRGTRSLESSVISAGNTRTVHAVSTTLSWHPLSSLSCRLRFTFQNDDYHNPVKLADGTEVHESRDIQRGGLNVSYRPPLSWLVFSVGGRYTSDSSNIPGHDRDRKRISTSVTAIY